MLHSDVGTVDMVNSSYHQKLAGMRRRTNLQCQGLNAIANDGTAQHLLRLARLCSSLSSKTTRDRSEWWHTPPARWSFRNDENVARRPHHRQRTSRGCMQALVLDFRWANDLDTDPQILLEDWSHLFRFAMLSAHKSRVLECSQAAESEPTQLRHWWDGSTLARSPRYCQSSMFKTFPQPWLPFQFKHETFNGNLADSLSIASCNHAVTGILPNHDNSSEEENALPVSPVHVLEDMHSKSTNNSVTSDDSNSALMGII